MTHNANYEVHYLDQGLRLLLAAANQIQCLYCTLILYNRFNFLFYFILSLLISSSILL